MIQTVAPERPDHALNIGVLPGRPQSNRAIAYPHRSDSVREGLPIGTIIIANQISRCCVPRECLYDLSRQPFCRRMLGHREPQELSSTMAHDERGVAYHPNYSYRGLLRRLCSETAGI